MSEQLAQQLQEASGRISQLETQNARLAEALLLRDARDYVAAQLATSTLPDITKTRLAESLSANPPVKDGALDKATYAARITEAVTAETQYLQQVAGYGSGKIIGMNSSPVEQQVDAAAIEKRMTEGFAALGLSESEVKHATNGRRY